MEYKSNKPMDGCAWIFFFYIWTSIDHISILNNKHLEISLFSNGYIFKEAGAL